MSCHLPAFKSKRSALGAVKGPVSKHVFPHMDRMIHDLRPVRSTTT